MKKVLFALILLLSINLCASSQTVTPARSASVAKVKTSLVPAAPAAKIKSANSVKLKADGTPDRRFKANEGVKNDGTLDMRYKKNKIKAKKK